MRRDKYRFVSPPGALKPTGIKVKITPEDEKLVRDMQDDLERKYGKILTKDEVEQYRKTHRLTHV